MNNQIVKTSVRDAWFFWKSIKIIFKTSESNTVHSTLVRQGNQVNWVEVSRLHRVPKARGGAWGQSRGQG